MGIKIQPARQGLGSRGNVMEQRRPQVAAAGRQA
jgi:hypothetical protein